MTRRSLDETSPVAARVRAEADLARTRLVVRTWKRRFLVMAAIALANASQLLLVLTTKSGAGSGPVWIAGALSVFLLVSWRRL